MNSRLNLKALDCTRPCNPQSHRRVSNREGTRSFCRTFSSDSKASDCNRTTPKIKKKGELHAMAQRVGCSRGETRGKLELKGEKGKEDEDEEEGGNFIDIKNSD